MTRKPTTGSHVDGLRDWARGMYPIEAATELLIRAGFADAGRPWIGPCDPPSQRWWVDFETVAAQAADGPWSGGERRLLALAASIAGEHSPGFTLGDALPGIDQATAALVLRAMIHATGQRTAWGDQPAT